MTAGMRRLSTMVLAAMLIAGGLFTLPSRANAPVLGQSFTWLQNGFTQELIGVSRDFLTPPDEDGNPTAILGGVAFDSHGNPVVTECMKANTQLHRFDLNSTNQGEHGTDLLGDESIIDADGGCGAVNHPDGFIYVAMNKNGFGIARINRQTLMVEGYLGDPTDPNPAKHPIPAYSLGIAVDPQVNISGTHDLVYAGIDCQLTLGCTYIRVNPATGIHSEFAHLTLQDADFTDGMYFDPSGQYLFIANRSHEIPEEGDPNESLYRLTILARDGHVVRHVPMESEPDGIAFHAESPKFVVSNNIDGTMTRFNFPDDDYSQLPQAEPFASGGFRGDLTQVGDDGCIYVTQKGVRYNDGFEVQPSPQTSDTPLISDNSLVRICGGFAPPPGVEHTESNTGTVSGTVFEDTDHNGTQDTDEPGIPHVPVTITGGPGNTTTTTTTDASGHFEFTDLPPGTFTIDLPEPPAGLEGPTTTPVTVATGNPTTVTSFPFVSGSIAGFAYIDVDGNGFKGSGEFGISGVTITLAGVGTQVTAFNGGYKFSSLGSNPNYSVSAPDAAAGKTRSTASPLGVALAAGEDKTDVNFGYVPGGLSGFAYVDLNANGVKDGGEPGIDGVTITLSGASSSTTTTTGGGAYSFAGLDAGGFSVSAPSAADGKSLATASSLNVTLAEGEHSPDHNFGYVPGAISGFAYVDTNGNDTMDAGEPGIPGVSLALSGHASDSTTTGADGSYAFAALDGGSYSVTAPAVAAAKALSTTSPLPVPLAAGEDRTHVDFGYAPGGVAGFAYVDVNNNGVKDAGEPGIPGVTVTLSGSPTVTTTTGSDGSYSFSAIEAGTHSVAAPSTAAGKNLTTGSPLTVPLAAGEHKTDVNFGYVPGSISGFAYVDSNGNGVKDSGEPGIQSVTITLSGGATQVTAADGSYTFTSLDGGGYSVSAPDSAGTNTRSTPSPLTVTLVAGGSVPNVNFGYVPPIATVQCSKATVQSVLDPATGRYPGNRGPDRIVRFDQNQSVQSAIDSVGDSNDDGYLLILVLKDGTGALGGNRTESIEISQYYSKPFGLFGCSVTLHDANLSNGKPTARITTSAGSAGTNGNIYVMDLHASDSEAEGWLVEGNGRYLRNVEARSNAIGVRFVGNSNMMHNGAVENNVGAGLVLQGNSNTATDTDAFSNGSHGVQVTGSSNQVLKVDSGDKNKGNGGDGVHVEGAGNLIQENDAFANGGDGIELVASSGAANVLKKNRAGDKSGTRQCRKRHSRRRARQWHRESDRTRGEYRQGKRLGRHPDYRYRPPAQEE